MVQDNQFSFDSAVFPPGTSTGHTLLQDVDPVTYRILQFYRGILQGNLGARWTQQCTTAGLVNANLQNMLDGYIVGDAICYPVPTTLKQTDYKFPLLSVYRAKETYRQMSTHHIVTESDYRIIWTLPPLNSGPQLNNLYPFLSAVSKTILFYTFEGSDPKYNNGELVWNEAGFAFATIEGAEIGSFLGQDGKSVFPSVKISLKVFERNQFVPDNYIPLTGFDGYIDQVDGYNINDPVVNFIEFVTNPALVISSFTPVDGPILGNTQVVVFGTGFLGANFQQQSQITIAGQACLNFEIKSDSAMIVTTAYTTAGVSGPIVVTDSQGNTATSTQLFTYS